jgi:hypothetical protein
MTIIDPTTSLGKIRLRIGDWNDPVILPDSVIQAALDDSSQSVTKAASTCAFYILAVLTQQTHKKLATLELWGKERFDNYLKFIQVTIDRPSLGLVAPVPYSSIIELNKTQEFMSDWTKNYYQGTESQQLALNASMSPNDGTKFGPLGYNTGSLE